MNWLSVGLSFSLFLQLVLTPALAQEAPPPQRLEIVVVEGEGAINNIRQRTGAQIIVEVQDENHRPVAGAAVVFTLPTEGPGGEFADGSRNLTIITDDQGRAVVRNLKINKSTGKIQIHVNASYRGRTASTNITQFNMDVPGTAKAGGSGKWIAILAIAGAAAAGGVIAATRAGGSSSSSSPAGSVITITPGTGTVGAPR